MSLEISSHCRQLVGCQTPNFFSRIAGLSPRFSTASQKAPCDRVSDRQHCRSGHACLLPRMILLRLPAWAGLVRGTPNSAEVC